MEQPTTPCTCGGTLILRGTTWGCDRMTDDPATHGHHAFADRAMRYRVLTPDPYEPAEQTELLP